MEGFEGLGDTGAFMTMGGRKSAWNNYIGVGEEVVCICPFGGWVSGCFWCHGMA